MAEIPEAAKEAANLAMNREGERPFHERRQTMDVALEAALPAIHADLRKRLLGDEALAAGDHVRRQVLPRGENLNRRLFEAALDSIGLTEATDSREWCSHKECDDPQRCERTGCAMPLREDDRG